MSCEISVMGREKSLAKNTAILTIGTVVPKVLTLITLPIVTSFLTEKEYGTYDLIITWITILLPLITLRLEAASFRFLIDDKNNINKRQEILTSIGLPIIILGIIWSLLCGVIFKQFIEYKVFFSLIIFIQVIYTYLLQTARGFSKNTLYTIAILIESILNSCFIILFVYFFKFRLGGLLLALLLSQTVSSIVILCKINIIKGIRFDKFKLVTTFRALKYSIGLIPNALSNWVVNLSDRLIINFYINTEANALYAVANKLPGMAYMFVSSLSLAWSEIISISEKDSDSVEFASKVFDKLMRLFASIICIAIALSPVFYLIFIDSKYKGSLIHNNILLMASFCLSVSSLLGGVYIAHRRTWKIAVSTIIAAIINFIFNMMFISDIGVYAASLSTLIAYIIMMGIRIIDVVKNKWIILNYRHLLYCFISIFIFFAGDILAGNAIFAKIVLMVTSILLFFLMNKEIVKDILIKFKSFRNK